nr:Chain B, Serine acetyltransferase 1 [Arabidopsis thaliana]
TEWSDYVI